MKALQHKKESCKAGFSACGGSRKRHLPIRRSAILAERFLFHRNAISYETKNCPAKCRAETVADTIFMHLRNYCDSPLVRGACACTRSIKCLVHDDIRRNSSLHHLLDVLCRNIDHEICVGIFKRVGFDIF